MTGLPIDSRIQPQSHANKVYGNKVRSALAEVSSLKMSELYPTQEEYQEILNEIFARDPELYNYIMLW